MEELGGGSSPGCHQRGCEAAPEAEFPKALSAVLMGRKQRSVSSRQRVASGEQEESDVSSTHVIVKQPQKDRSAIGNKLKGFLGERFRSHPVGTAVLMLLLQVLVLALGVALAVQSAAPHVPVTPATPLLVLGCPHDWVGYKGVCYYFSRDSSTWEQGQERCSKLNASLAIAKDEEAIDLLFRLRGNGDFWLGLRRRGERLHWGDGSSYSSRVHVFGNSECVYLAEERFRSVNCSNERPYLCSKAQAPL